MSFGIIVGDIFDILAAMTPQRIREQFGNHFEFILLARWLPFGIPWPPSELRSGAFGAIWYPFNTFVVSILLYFVPCGSLDGLVSFWILFNYFLHHFEAAGPIGAYGTGIWPYMLVFAAS